MDAWDTRGLAALGGVRGWAAVFVDVGGLSGGDGLLEAVRRPHSDSRLRGSLVIAGGESRGRRPVGGRLIPSGCCQVARE